MTKTKLTTAQQLTKATKKLGKNHKKKKDGEAALKEDRKKFFDLVTKHITKEVPLANRTVTATVDEVDAFATPEEWAATLHPGWEIDTMQPLEQDILRIVLKEDPAWVKFVFINDDDGMVYQKNVIEGAPSVDDEALAADHPDVWLRITEAEVPDWLTMVAKFIDWEISVEEVQREEEHPDRGDAIQRELTKWLETEEIDIPRKVIDLTQIAPEDLAILVEYTVPGELSLRLESPRKAKPEDYDENND